MKEKYRSGEITHWNKGNHLSDDTKAKISKTLEGHKNFDVGAIKTRNHTIQRKIDAGWVSPLKNRPLSKEHALKSKKTLQSSNDKKRKEFHNIIVGKCKEHDLTIIKHDFYYYDLSCKQCDTYFNRTRQVFRASKNDGEKICPTCNPPSYVSSQENDFSKFIKSIYSGKIILNDRKQLSGKEIDCFLPDLNVGFEYCGLYWHSELYHEKNHLINKQKYALSRDIKIYTVFDCEWLQQRKIVESRIKSILGLLKNKLYARKTKILKIKSKDSNEFLKENHLQGGDKSPIRYGAFHGDILVAVMTFNKGGLLK